MLKQIALLSAVGVIAGSIAAGTLRADEPKGKSTDAKGEPVQRFAMNPLHVNIAVVESVKPDGEVTVKDLGNPRFILNKPVAGLNDLTEGRYLGFVGKDFSESTKDVRVVALQIVEVKKDKAVLQVSQAAAKQIEAGEDVLFFRPPGSTTAELKAAPDFARVDDGVKTATLGTAGGYSRASMTTSKNNLKQIGLAMHNFHDVHRHFPPAVVYGPDGKPWHSWRVFLLPYLDQQALYNQYRFDEPWDGPNNRKLAETIVTVYQDPAYGRHKNSYTNYVVATGKDAAFPGDGVKMTKKADPPLANARKAGATGFRDITDGTSNTILVGTIGPERKIPWSKPEDVPFDKDFSRLGEKGSFAMPYKQDDRSSGLFLFADGSVRTINSDVDHKTVRNLIQRNDGQPTQLPDMTKRRRTRFGNDEPAQYVEFHKTAKGVTARLVAE